MLFPFDVLSKDQMTLTLADTGLSSWLALFREPRARVYSCTWVAALTPAQPKLLPTGLRPRTTKDKH